MELGETWRGRERADTGEDRADDASAYTPLLRPCCSLVPSFPLKGSGDGAALLGICVGQQKIVVAKLENERCWNPPENAGRPATDAYTALGDAVSEPRRQPVRVCFDVGELGSVR